MKKRKFWSIMLVCSLLLTLPSMEVFADSIGNINSGDDATVNLQTEGLGDAGGDIGTEADKESESKEDNESGEETEVSADTTPEEDDKGKQENSGQTEEAEETGNVGEAETVDELDVKVVAVEMMEADEAEMSGSCGENLTWKLEGEVLKFSGTGEMYSSDDGDYAFPWYKYKDAIVCVIIDDTVTSIGRNAFRGCSSLTSIELPSGLISIGSNAFEGCSSLTSIELPSGLTYIGGHAFEGCSNLKNIKLPSELTNIGYSIFKGCSSLSSIELPSGLTLIYRETFEGCSSLTSIKLPTGITTIEFDAFRGCSSLTSMELPSGVTSIGESAFEGCSSLASIELPSGLTSIGSNAFEGCSSLTSIELPSGLTGAIGFATFRECRSLRSIELPPGITTIWYDAFEGCSSLTSIELPTGITTIGGSAFAGCSSLTSIELPTGITTIGVGTFAGCSSLTSIELPSGVTTIDYNAFAGCSSLTSIELPAGVTTIEYNVFGDCSGLTSIELPTGVTSIEARAFEGCSSLTSIELPSGVTYIGDWAFRGCSSLTDIYYGGSESDWLSITIYSDNEPLTTATIHYNSTGSGTGDKPKPPVPPSVTPTDTTVHKMNIPFYPWYAGETTLSMDWGWELIMEGNSAVYDNRLAKISLALSGAAEHSQESAENLLKTQMGTDTELILSRNYDLDWDDWDTPGYPGVTFGHKTVLKDNGDKEHIIVMVVRGTKAENLVDIRTDLSVAGFSLSAANLSKQLEEYIYACSLNTGEITRNNAKFLITGHSLGGVVANKVAHGLNGSYGIDNVYAYTFAAPLSTKATDNYSYNIHNILNVEDMIPNLTNDFSSCRYGNDWWFYRDASPKMYSTFEDNFGLLLSSCINKHKILGHHAVETYMAYLLTGDDIVWKQISAGKASVCCPVDVKVYNSAGKLVGSVTDNQVDEETLEDGVVIFTGGADNDEKHIYFLKDDTYSLELTATDSGTMQYTMQYVNRSTNEILQEKSFRNVSLTDGKQMTSSVSVWDKNDPTINIDDKIDTPQVQLLVLDEDGNTVKEVLSDGKGTEVPYTGPIEVLPEDIPADGIPDGLWIAGVENSYTYTGTAIKPEIRVYDGKKRLQPGQDFIASYKNNTKVNDAAKISTAPTITVKGKGNYAGSETAKFQITAVDLSDSIVLAEDITVAYNKKLQKKVPIVTYNGKKLAANIDFTVSYPNGGDGAYKEVGTYDILLTAKSGGNFSGTRTVKCTITDNTLLSKVSVKKIPAQVYTGEAIEPELTVTFKGVPLVKDTDYSVSYTDNIEIGTAKAILTGIGKYAGMKNVSFSITGTSLKGASVSGIENKIYNGCDQKQSFTVMLKGKALTEGIDYDVFYENNKNVGKANVTIKGKGAYTGTINKTFTIEKFNVAANADGRFEVKLEQDVVPYAKVGAKPGVTVRFKRGNEKWETLVEGQDYTLSYRNHTAVNDGSKQNKQPVVTVKGKGSFSGTYATALTYKIVAQDIGQLTLTARDKTYQNKKNVFTTSITITDLDGKALKPGTDYNKVLTYSYANEATVNTAGNGTSVRAAGSLVDKNDIIPAGTVLKVQADAKSGGNYVGSLIGEYRITQATISSASVYVPKQIYTGRAITLEKNQITFKIKGKQLDESQYEIVPNSYKNNVNKGTATVTIRGLDNYGGTKDIRFTIKAKGFLWWWR